MQDINVIARGIDEADAVQDNVTHDGRRLVAFLDQWILRRPSRDRLQDFPRDCDPGQQGLCGRGNSDNGKGPDRDGQRRRAHFRHGHLASGQIDRAGPERKSVDQIRHGVHPRNHARYHVLGLSVGLGGLLQHGQIPLGEEGLDPERGDMLDRGDGLLGNPGSLTIQLHRPLVMSHHIRPAQRLRHDHDDKERADDQRRLPIHDGGHDERRAERGDGGQHHRQLARDRFLDCPHIRHDAARDLAGAQEIEERHILAQDGGEIGGP